MPTRLDKPIKREVTIKGEPYTVVIDADGVAIAPKGRRARHSMTWESLATGDAELTRDLKASLQSSTRKRSSR